VTSKGQVTIPIRIRERLGRRPGTEVIVDVMGDSVRIRKALGSRRQRGRAVVARMKDKVRTRMTTEEILAVTRG